MCLPRRRGCGKSVRGSAAPPHPKPFKNSRCLPMSAKTFELEKFSKHRMLIFNQVNVPRHDMREGTMDDVAALKECFGALRFEIDCYDDCKADEIFSVMNTVTQTDLSDYGCFAVVVLTHGTAGGVLMTYDHNMHENDFIDFMKGSTTPGLITKPKLLIVQACRGDEVSSAVVAGETYAHSISRDEFIEPEKPYKLSNETDLLLLHSSYPGKVSHRTKLGSWFIKSLCNIINKSSPHEDILSIITEVIHYVSIHHEVEYERKKLTEKQVPVCTSTLSRKLYLKAQTEADTDVVPSNVMTDSLILLQENVVERTEQDLREIEAKEENLEHFLSTNFPSYTIGGQAFCHKGFRLEYFLYIRNVLNDFIEKRRGEGEPAEVATALLDIARTIDCDEVFSKTREQTCLQMMKFLQKQDLDERVNMFFYKYYYH